jgi:anti-anti-sigma factor
MVILQGELDIRYADQAAAGFNRALDHDPTVLAADLRGLTFMDSTGAHALLDAASRCRTQGVRFLIIRGSPRIHLVLSALGLDRWFEIISSPEQLPDESAGLAAAV